MSLVQLGKSRREERVRSTRNPISHEACLRGELRQGEKRHKETKKRESGAVMLGALKR